jgi:hypothetical protein
MTDSEKLYRGDMPESTERYLHALLDDESYTWFGFANCIAKRLNKNDLEELVRLLIMELEGKEAGDE